jgi:hypothetical protein
VLLLATVFNKFPKRNFRLLRSTRSGVVCHGHPDAEGSALFSRSAQRPVEAHRRKQAAPEGRPAGFDAIVSQPKKRRTWERC